MKSETVSEIVSKCNEDLEYCDPGLTQASEDETIAKFRQLVVCMYIRIIKMYTTLNVWYT